MTERGGIVRVSAAPAGLIGGTPGGGGPSLSTNAKITSFSTSGQRIKCKLLDSAGAVTGSEFEVRVRIVGSTIGLMDAYAVENNTIPSLNVGQYVMIAQMTVYHSGAGFVTGWWTWDQYALRGC